MTDHRFRKLAPSCEARAVMWCSHEHNPICGIQNRPQMFIVPDMAIIGIDECLRLSLVYFLFIKRQRATHLLDQYAP